MDKRLVKAAEWFEQKSRELGMDFFDINFEMVPEEVMLEASTYGLPTRFRHWSFGQSYEYQKANGEMGYSKLYEVIFNNDPSYAFLLDTNPVFANVFVISHCFGHSCFSKKNICFLPTDKKMVYHAAERAERIDEYIKKYGDKRVERIIDIGMALERNIDLHRGQYRDPYKRRKSTSKSRFDEFDDLLGAPKKQPPVRESFPPHPEKDILWFLINYSKLSDWEKDVLSIIRDESYYFSAIINTKICNEGFASVVHAELMALAPKDIVTEEEYLDFVNLHSKVVQPGSDPTNLNPYYFGFSILQDVRRRWDEKFAKGESTINGWQKILQIVETEDDTSLIRNYLTQELVDKMNLFAYRIINAHDGSQFLEIESRKVDDVINFHISKSFENRTPVITINKADANGLELVHQSKDIGTLDIKHMKRVMGYLKEIWGGMIDLETVDENGDKIHFTYDEDGFSGEADEVTEEF